jgi:hypothetical protein
MITKNTAKRRIKTPINTVVPQPGNTLPASEFSGRNKVPSGVTIPGSNEPDEAFDFEEVVAICLRIK